MKKTNNIIANLKFNFTTSTVATVLQASLFLFCSAMQFIPFFRHNFNEFTCLPCIDDSVAGIFLQIDATMVTLTIALMAIVSGLISVSYMGICYTDFLFNIQPIGYKQKLVIKISLLYLAIAIFSIWADWYYLVAGFLFCELLLIYMSALSIFAFFKGRNYLQDRIKSYSQATQLGLCQCCQDGKEKQGRVVLKDDNKTMQDMTARDVQDKFIEAFGEILQHGSEDEYEDYIELFLKVTEGVWEKRNEKDTVYSLEQYQRNVTKLIYVCIKSKNPVSKLLALHLIDNVYEVLSNCIKRSFAKSRTWKLKENVYENVPSSNTRADGTAQQFKLRKTLQLISSYEFKALLRKTNINELEEKVSIQRILSNINFVDMVLFYEQCQEEEIWGSNANVLAIQAYLGQYMAEQKQKGNIPSMGHWSRDFWNNFLKPIHEASVEVPKLPIYYKALGNSGIMYTCGLLAAGCFEIVQEGLYKNILAYPTYCNAVIKRIVAAVHPYIYYMSTREEADCIDAGLLDQVKAFWDRNAGIYDNFISINDDITKLWIENLNAEYRTVYVRGTRQRKRDEKSGWIYSLLSSFDFKMYSDKGGFLILPEAITDFCLFSILYPSFGVQLDWLEDDYHMVEDFTRYVQTGHEDEVKRAIDDYVWFRKGYTLEHEKNETDKATCENNIDNADKQDPKNEEKNNRIIDDKAEEIYKHLVTGIKYLYKKKKKKEARKWQADYLENLETIEGEKEKWKNELLKTLKETFGEIISFYDDSDTRYYDVIFPKFHVYTNDVKIVFNESNMARVVASLIDDFICLLIKQGYLDRKKFDDFKDDQDYMCYLQNKLLNWLIGSEYLLMNKDFRMSEKFREVTKDYIWIKNIGCSYAMAIRRESVMFYFKDLDVRIRQAGIKDVDVGNDSEVLAYEPVQGVKLQYRDSLELEEFVGQEKKVIEVIARIAVDVYGERPIGIYFTSV